MENMQRNMKQEICDKTRDMRDVGPSGYWDIGKLGHRKIGT